VLAAAGLDADRDVRRQRLSFAASAEALKDGKIDACFVAAAAPNSALMDVASVRERRMRLVPLDDVIPALQRAYGAGVYLSLVISARTYPGVDVDVPVVGVNNVLVADMRLDEAVAHDITRTLFEHKAELVAVHRSANDLTLASAIAGSSAPYHPARSATTVRPARGGDAEPRRPAATRATGAVRDRRELETEAPTRVLGARCAPSSRRSRSGSRCTRSPGSSR
jgi:TRAP transporter TAXI family solute receptor